ncbi:Os11g0692400 [Oryza sativa Japonica Group]|uniref:Os11g0692400 protein n=2 Tax=Oryza sativa subsp. japonica TaxID=39947 RepID=C7J8J9_ORYSJ|nr:Os11g0692400 [Oryza sativa Japonica Group]BAT15327.1 Os11g0692400 [Oryza sativa Japonica Group]|eukprot:NP_001176727.1 Os11g0692400 [Oryza sativa Japonica Group]
MAAAAPIPGVVAAAAPPSPPGRGAEGGCYSPSPAWARSGSGGGCFPPRRGAATAPPPPRLPPHLPDVEPTVAATPLSRHGDGSGGGCFPPRHGGSSCPTVRRPFLPGCPLTSLMWRRWRFVAW